MSRDAPTRSAIACCVSFSGTIDVPSARGTASVLIRRTRRPYTSVSARLLTSSVVARTRLISFSIRCSAKSGFLRMNSRNCSRCTTAHTVGSIVTTDAERTPPSSVISPTYSPAPWNAIANSRPCALLA